MKQKSIALAQEEVSKCSRLKLLYGSNNWPQLHHTPLWMCRQKIILISSIESGRECLSLLLNIGSIVIVSGSHFRTVRLLIFNKKKDLPHGELKWGRGKGVGREIKRKCLCASQLRVDASPPKHFTRVLVPMGGGRPGFQTRETGSTPTEGNGPLKVKQLRPNSQLKSTSYSLTSAVFFDMTPNSDTMRSDNIGIKGYVRERTKVSDAAELIP